MFLSRQHFTVLPSPVSEVFAKLQSQITEFRLPLTTTDFTGLVTRTRLSELTRDLIVEQ
ncbi:hypothetical protein [Tsukamurella sp. NPDC003166]|uniref:hypothetical protein n=1 Tax=Tsukamurella sp. NPDC003166 TaxID=3154444 RepID=UPI0033B1D1D7